eukprot:6551929-Alexandrium_andersonii.AAC.1
MLTRAVLEARLPSRVRLAFFEECWFLMSKRSLSVSWQPCFRYRTGCRDTDKIVNATCVRTDEPQ